MYKTALMPYCYNRPGKPLKAVKGIVVHYVCAVGGKAATVRNNFIKNSAIKKDGSCHDIIDLNGDILHIIPYNEIAYHVGAKKYTDFVRKKWGKNAYPNSFLIGIEMCHYDASAKPTKCQKQVLIDLCADLCRSYCLTEQDVYLHNEITGKWCHKYYCDNPQEWWEVKAKIKERIEKI